MNKKYSQLTEQQRENRRNAVKKWFKNNREYVRAMSKAYYEKHRNEVKRKNAKLRAQNLEFYNKLSRDYRRNLAAYIDKLRRAGKCAKCGNADFRVLKFAHKKGQIKTIVVGSARSWKQLHAELAKCWLLCANCHDIYDWNEKQRRIKAQRRKENGNTGH